MRRRKRPDLLRSAPQMNEKAWLAYGDAAPYLLNMEWTKLSIARTIEESRNLIELREKIQKLKDEEKEPTRKSDLRIYLIYLEKVMQK